MSITDELRTGGIYRPASNRRYFIEEELTAIADRIDAAHQKAEDEWKAKDGQTWLRGYNKGFASHEDAMTEDGWVKLPLDADGVPICVGDVMEFSAFEVEKPVTRMVDGIGQGVFFAWCGERGYQQHEAKRYRHHHELTVEDVLREMLYKAHIYDEREMKLLPDLIAEYAAKLRLVGDAE